MSGADLIAAERQRQINVEGYELRHDAAHSTGDLAVAAECYLVYGAQADPPRLWPWHYRYWKPTPGDRVRQLVKAGALIAAEIDRLAGLPVTADDPRPAGEACQALSQCVNALGRHDRRCPAASGGATDGEREHEPHSRACGWRRHDHGPECHSNCPTCGGLPAEPPVASQADEGLREVAEQLWHDLINEDDQGAVDKLIPLLADAAKVQRVEELITELRRDTRTMWTDKLALCLRRALDEQP